MGFAPFLANGQTDGSVVAKILFQKQVCGQKNCLYIRGGAFLPELNKMYKKNYINKMCFPKHKLYLTRFHAHKK